MRRLLARVIIWLQQRYCGHAYYLDDLRPRDSDDMVSCACARCGLVIRAPYGLALPGTWLGHRHTEEAWP